MFRAIRDDKQKISYILNRLRGVLEEKKVFVPLGCSAQNRIFILFQIFWREPIERRHCPYSRWPRSTRKTSPWPRAMSTNLRTYSRRLSATLAQTTSPRRPGSSKSPIRSTTGPLTYLPSPIVGPERLRSRATSIIHLNSSHHVWSIERRVRITRLYKFHT